MGATRGQHYLPRLLLKGFASRTKGKKIWVYYFQRACAAKEVSIRDIAKETDFHGHPAESPLEKKMEVVESMFGPHVARWRDGGPLTGEDAELIPQLVGHLIVRTKGIRDGFAEGAEVVKDEIARRLDTGELDLVNVPGIEDEVVRRIQRDPLFGRLAQGMPREFRALVAAEIGELNRTGEAHRWVQHISKVLQATDVTAPIKRGHVEALIKNQIPLERVRVLRQMRWSVVRTNPEGMILGDVVAVAIGMDETEFKNPFAIDLEKIVLFCCPISSTAVLLGCSAGFHYKFSAAEINRATAELSREFFVASERNEKFDDLQKILGKRADIMSAEEIRNLLPNEVPAFPKDKS